MEEKSKDILLDKLFFHKKWPLILSIGIFSNV